jgi:hypothetical protein
MEPWLLPTMAESIIRGGRFSRLLPITLIGFLGCEPPGHGCLKKLIRQSRFGFCQVAKLSFSGRNAMADWNFSTDPESTRKPTLTCAT